MNKKLVHSVFDYVADHHPENIAIQEVDRKISYKALKKFSNNIANFLVEFNLPSASNIVVYQKSSVEYIASILGINKARHVFVPLDINYPELRLIHIINEVLPEVIVTDKIHETPLKILLSREEVAEKIVKIIVVELDGKAVLQTFENGVVTSQSELEASDKEVEVNLSGDESNYLLYTSGSTGKPKAIEGSHKSLSHFIHWEIKEFGLTETTKALQFAPLLFDVSLRDIFVPLLVGGTVMIPVAAAKFQPEQLLKWMAEVQVSLLHIVPSMMRAMLRSLQENADLLSGVEHLQHVLLAGEALYGRDVDLWRSVVGAGAQLVNLYGPSETTLAKLFYRVPEEIIDASAIIPLGYPISNTMVLIIKNNRLCEIGEIGEIYIKTPFMSKGYYNNASLTHQYFIQNPIHNDQKDIVYMTGDLARYGEDRRVDFIGRQDSQVKIRGNRVEISEVEQVIMKFANIGQVVVLPLINAGGDNILACYYLANDKIQISELREHLSIHLSEYMHPSFYVGVENFPLSLNGKIDKKKLPKPEDLLYQQQPYIAPSTPLEQQLVDIWASVLKLKKVGVKNSFFELGGHSLSATQVASRVYKDIGKELTLQEFFNHSTIVKLAQLLGAKKSLVYRSIDPIPVQEDYDVTHAQKRLWILNEIEEDRIAYNIPEAHHFRGGLNLSALDKSLQALVSRHESLRTVFFMKEGILRQKVLSIDEYHDFYQYIDLRKDLDIQGRLGQITKEEGMASFDMEKGPLLRAKLLHFGEEDFVFLFTMHHIISDGWSRNVLISDLVEFYNAYEEGKQSTLKPIRIQYKDYAHWQNTQLANSDESDAHQLFWKNKFSGHLPVLDFPTDFSRPKIKTYNGNKLGFVLDHEVSKSISKMAEKYEASLFMVLIATVKILINRYTGAEDITLGTPIAGRDHYDLEDQIGLYVNTLALRTNFTNCMSFEDILSIVKENTLAAYEHQIYPFDKLVDDLDLDRDMSRSPLFDMMIVLQNAGGSSTNDGMKGVEVSGYNDSKDVSKFDITFSFSQREDNIYLGIEYNVDLFNKERIDRMFVHYHELLTSIVAQPEASVAQLSYIGVSERKALIGNEYNQISSYPSEATIPQFFESQVALSPQSIALTSGGKTLSYEGLNTRANQLAHYLRSECGVTPNTRVALLMSRSEQLVIGILGILKSGGCYVPIDPSYPAERINYSLQDSGTKVIVLDGTVSPEPYCTDYQVVSTHDDLLNSSSTDNPVIINDPDDIAYIIFTSGSTGTPKGVMVTHRNLVSLLFTEDFPFRFGALDVWTLFHSVCFDFSVWEVFGSLLYGGRLVVVGKHTSQSTEDFVNLLEQERVTVLNQVPTMFGNVIKEVLNRPERAKLALRYVIFGGEALNPSMLKDWYTCYPDTQLVNMYGITETTIHVTYKEIGAEEIHSGQSNIGHPIPSLRVFIMDDNHELMPQGTVGEIVVGGSGVTNGYQNLETLTQERFIESPFHEGERLYCSGDLGMQLSNGELIYKGRKDDQVKIRGYRIELGEIEQHLLSHQGIDTGVVISREDAAGVSQLLAYFTSTNTLTVEELRAHLSQYLPEYMLPSHFISLENLPLTTNGKIDRKSLPDPEGIGLETAMEYVAAENEQQKTLIEVYSKVLGRTQIGIEDNFFVIGGDSIKAIQISSFMQRDGFKVSVRDIYQNPTIRELSLVMQKVDRIADQSVIVGELPLTPIQHRFFEIERQNNHHYNQAVLLSYKERFEISALRKTFEELQAHHDILRVTFRADNDTIIQFNNDLECQISIEEFDLQTEEQPYELLNNLCNTVQQSIDLSSGPLMKLGLFHLKDGDRLLIAIHHLAIDGVSWRILFEDLELLYKHIVKEEAFILPLKTDSFKLWAEKLTAYSNSKEFLKEIEYWETIDASYKNLIPKDYLQENNLIIDTQTQSFSLSEEDTELLLTKVNAPFSTEINDILLLSLGLAVKDQFGIDKLLIALEGHGREEIIEDIDISRTVGWFTSIYPILINVGDTVDMTLQIKKTKEMLRNIPNKGVGYGILKYMTSKENKFEVSLEAKPQISFNYLGQFDSDIKDTFFKVSSEPKGSIKDINGSREFSIDVSGLVSSNKLIINIEYNKKHFKESTISKLAEAYHQSLSHIISYCASITEKDLSPSDLGFSELSINDLDTFFE